MNQTQTKPERVAILATGDMGFCNTKDGNDDCCACAVASTI
jgi:hypothetical protein